MPIMRRQENKKNFEKARIFLNIENLYPDIYKEEEQDRERKLKEAIEKAATDSLDVDISSLFPA